MEQATQVTEEVCLFRETALRDGAAATLERYIQPCIAGRASHPGRKRRGSGGASVASIGNAAFDFWWLHAARCEGAVAPLYLGTRASKEDRERDAERDQHEAQDEESRGENGEGRGAPVGEELEIGPAWEGESDHRATPVSYTHLTLPTICSV